MLRHKIGGILRHPGYNDIGVGDAIGIGVKLVGGAMGSDAASDGADAMQGASEESMRLMQEQRDMTRKDTRVYRDAGKGAQKLLSYLLGVGAKTDKYDWEDFRNYNEEYAPSWYSADGPQVTDTNIQYDKYLNRINSGGSRDRLFDDQELTDRGFRTLNDYSGHEFGSLLKDFTLSDLNKDVVYNKGLEFGLNEGTKALDRRSSALGNWDSGATLKALTRFGNDYGETKAGGAYNRFMANKQNIYNMLSGQAGMGLNAVGLDSNVGVNLATGMGNAGMQGANAYAAGQMGQANALGGALSGIGNAFGGIGNGGTLNFGSIFGGGGGSGGINLAGRDPWSYV